MKTHKHPSFPAAARKAFWLALLALALMFALAACRRAQTPDQNGEPAQTDGEPQTEGLPADDAPADDQPTDRQEAQDDTGDTEQDPADEPPVSTSRVILDFDLSENNRFYFLNEPFSTGFYIYGKWVTVSPKISFQIDAKSDPISIPYFSRNLTVTGFDSQTVGVKHVTVSVQGIYDGENYYGATASYDVEVRDYDHDKYGFAAVSEDQYVTYPAGFTLTATPKNADWVMAYNWLDSNESFDHAAACSRSNYQPYNFFTGTTAFTDTLVAPASFDTAVEQLRLLVIYDDLTRVYTREIWVIADLPAAPDSYAQLGEYVFTPGQTLDLSALGIGSGTILFHENGYEFTFTDVNFVNDKYQTDGFRSAPGFQYFYKNTAETHYQIHLVGNNYLTNTYWREEAAGIALNFQFIGNNAENRSDLTISGPGSLHFAGGAPSLYAECPLIIDTELTFSSYLGRMCNAVNANAIHLTDNARVRATNNGTGLLAMTGGILIEAGARVDLRLTMPRIRGSYATANAIIAAGDVIIRSRSLYISVTAAAEIYSRFEGVSSCVLINSDSGNILFDGACAELNVYASNSPSALPEFGTVLAIATSDGPDKPAACGHVYLVDSSVTIDLQADLFSEAYAVYGVNSVVVENTALRVSERCVTAMNGIYCSCGEITVARGSDVCITGARQLLEEEAFGVFALGVTVDVSRLAVAYNNGMALVAYLGRATAPADYEEGYRPLALVGFDAVDGVGAFSMMEAPGSFYVFETVFRDDRSAPATHFSVDNRTVS